MMTHTGFLWGAALYNNGGFPYKNTRFGESYDRDGMPQAIKTSPPPTPEETRTKGVLPEFTPLYRWEISQPGNVLRVFERGGQKKAELGNPQRRRKSGQARRQVERPRLRHGIAHRSCFSGFAENAPGGSGSFLSRHRRSSGRLPFQRLLRLPRDLRQRSRPRALRRNMRSIGHLGYSASVRPDDSQR